MKTTFAGTAAVSGSRRTLSSLAILAPIAQYHCSAFPTYTHAHTQSARISTKEARAALLLDSFYSRMGGRSRAPGLCSYTDYALRLADKRKKEDRWKGFDEKLGRGTANCAVSVS